MMRSALVAVIVVATSSSAHASIKLCTKRNYEIPEHPRFVVERTALGPGYASAEYAGTDHDRDTAQLPPGTDITYLDARYASITLPIVDGDRGAMPRPIVTGCLSATYHVTRGWRSPAAGLVLERASVQPLSATRDTLALAWSYDGLATTRVDWAYSAHDLDTARHGSRYTRSALAWLPVDATANVVHVRLVQYRVDGTEHVWRGWLERSADGELHIGDGPPPAPGPRCTPSLHPRVVPSPATFRTSDDDATLRATTLDGTPLAIRRTLDRATYTTTITVDVPPGVPFQLDELPAAGCPATLVALPDHVARSAPRVVGMSAPIQPSYFVEDELRIDLADEQAWDELDLEWAATPAELDTGLMARTRAPHDLTICLGHTAESDPRCVPPTVRAFYVRITPRWHGAVGPVAWDGWVIRHADGSVTFGELPSWRASEPLELDADSDVDPAAVLAALLLAVAAFAAAALSPRG
ncbi:MAG TPA: hypothetical protein VFQ53_04425 [Kofleriaceae bacterium]|nr:hypothetical protein [Kofleriaceae bacterium]